MHVRNMKCRKAEAAIFQVSWYSILALHNDTVAANFLSTLLLYLAFQSRVAFTFLNTAISSHSHSAYDM